MVFFKFVTSKVVLKGTGMPNHLVDICWGVVKKTGGSEVVVFFSLIQKRDLLFGWPSFLGDCWLGSWRSSVSALTECLSMFGEYVCQRGGGVHVYRWFI